MVFLNFRVKCASLIVFFQLLFATSPDLKASVIRHDVDEKNYVILAKQPQFMASRVGFYQGGKAIFSGTLIGPRHVLTTGHGMYHFLRRGQTKGGIRLAVKVNGQNRTGVYAFLHPRFSRGTGFGGADAAIVRLDKPVTNVTPATVWTAGLELKEEFVGVGMGKFTTAADRRYTKTSGTFRAFMNTIDYFGEHADFDYFLADMDNGQEKANTLKHYIIDFSNENFNNFKEIKGVSESKPLPFEGMSAPGDSGGGVWVYRDDKFYIAGVISYGRTRIGYGAQSGHLNLSDPKITYWISAVSNREKAGVKIIKPKPKPIRIPVEEEKTHVDTKEAETKIWKK